MIRFVCAIIVLHALITLNWVNAATKDLSYTCSLTPLTFNFYQQSDLFTYDIEVKRGDFVDLTTSAEVNIQGSGPCRHRIWSFDYHGPITIRELGCYGEIYPPKNAVGEISFDREVDYKRGVFFY